MKNKKAFTLVETLAVIILLGVILMIAVPSITGVVNRTNLNRLEEAAEMFVVLAKQELEKNVTIDYPTNTKCGASGVEKCYIVVFLDLIDKQQLVNIYGKEIGDSTPDPDAGGNTRPSKAVFSYESGKWINKFVVLYDGYGNAAYLDAPVVTSNSNDQNNPLVDKDKKYECVGEKHCYVKVTE